MISILYSPVILIPMKSLMILGRQAELGLAELESLYGAAKVQPAGSQAAIVDVDPCLLAFDRLGGSVKFCKLLTTLNTTNWGEVERFLIKVSPDQSRTMPEGKMLLGLSLYDFNESIQRIEATGLSLKKAIRKTDRPVRLVPNKEHELNSASVMHNKLTSPNGWELIFVKDGAQTHIAQTVKVQNIDAYARRDRERPMRDSRVGMLPPKLAQIIINLSVGALPEEQLQNICDIPAGEPVPRKLYGQTVLDPFCGTGVVLQEALLMGYDVYGTDLEQRMIEYTDKNIAWIGKEYDFDETKHGQLQTEAGDATNHSWKSADVNFVACETYLGRPFTSMPTPEVINQTISECNLIIKKFLQNLHSQLQPGARLCLAVPAWQTRVGQHKSLPLVDQIEALGYNQVSFEHAQEPLIYSRKEQIVARQLIVLIRK